jgi:hypothetical protein
MQFYRKDYTVVEAGGCRLEDALLQLPIYYQTRIEPFAPANQLFFTGGEVLLGSSTFFELPEYTRG